jgi:hypothetical protein
MTARKYHMLKRLFFISRQPVFERAFLLFEGPDFARLSLQSSFEDEGE